MFLIHYGWRGTFVDPGVIVVNGKVSNPLRLEGNQCSPQTPAQIADVSNPLRLEGNVFLRRDRLNDPVVSNPLRLEGN